MKNIFYHHIDVINNLLLLNYWPKCVHRKWLSVTKILVAIRFLTPRIQLLILLNINVEKSGTSKNELVYENVRVKRKRHFRVQKKYRICVVLQTESSTKSDTN